MTSSWSPRCHKCGGRGNAEVRPPPTMMFAGRIRPDAMKPFVFGTRVRCTKCLVWFTLGPGTEWRENTAAVKGHVPEPVPIDESESVGERHEAVRDAGGDAGND